MSTLSDKFLTWFDLTAADATIASKADGPVVPVDPIILTRQDGYGTITTETGGGPAGQDCINFSTSDGYKSNLFASTDLPAQSSMVCWFKCNNVGTQDVVNAIGGGAAASRMIDVRCRTDDVAAVVFNVGGSPSVPASHLHVHDTTTWHLLVVNYDVPGDAVEMYFDGVLVVDTIDFSAVTLFTGQILQSVGAPTYVVNDALRFDGLMSMAGLATSWLTQTEVSTLWNSGQGLAWDELPSDGPPDNLLLDNDFGVTGTEYILPDTSGGYAYHGMRVRAGWLHQSGPVTITLENPADKIIGVTSLDPYDEFRINMPGGTYSFECDTYRNQWIALGPLSSYREVWQATPMADMNGAIQWTFYPFGDFTVSQLVTHNAGVFSFNYPGIVHSYELVFEVDRDIAANNAEIEYTVDPTLTGTGTGITPRIIDSFQSARAAVFQQSQQAIGGVSPLAGDTFAIAVSSSGTSGSQVDLTSCFITWSI